MLNHTQDTLCRCRACKPALAGHSAAIERMAQGDPQIPARRTYRDSEGYRRSQRLDRAGTPIWPIRRPTIDAARAAQ